MEGETLLGIEHECRWLLALLDPLSTVERVNEKVREMFELQGADVVYKLVVDDDARKMLCEQNVLEIVNRVENSRRYFLVHFCVGFF